MYATFTPVKDDYPKLQATFGICLKVKFKLSKAKQLNLRNKKTDKIRLFFTAFRRMRL